MKTIDKVCPICKKTFSVFKCHEVRYITCSYLCGGIYRKKPRIKNKCLLCGVCFISKKSPTKPQRFCSLICSRSSRKNGICSLCKNCGNPIYIAKHRQLGKYKKIYCSEACRLDHWNTKSLLNQKPGCYRQNAWRTYEKRCYICGCTDERVLVIHHKDGNRSNGKIENLIPLCHNCHCIEHIKMGGDGKMPSYRSRG